MDNKRTSSDDAKNGYAGSVAGKTTHKNKTRGANLNLDSQLTDNHLVKYGINYRHQEAIPHFRKKSGDTVGRAPNTFVLPIDIVNQQKTDLGVYGELISTYDDFDL